MAAISLRPVMRAFHHPLESFKRQGFYNELILFVIKDSVHQVFNAVGAFITLKEIKGNSQLPKRVPMRSSKYPWLIPSTSDSPIKDLSLRVHMIWQADRIGYLFATGDTWIIIVSQPLSLCLDNHLLARNLTPLPFSILFAYRAEIIWTVYLWDVSRILKGFTFSGIKCTHFFWQYNTLW